MFNVIDKVTGLKVDFIFLKSRRFSLSAEKKPQCGRYLYTLLTPEDIVVAKLEWAKLGESSRQIEDAAGVLKVRGEELDRPYIEKWVKELDLARQWDEACRQAGLA
jgi:hypothetical protein